MFAKGVSMGEVLGPVEAAEAIADHLAGTCGTVHGTLELFGLPAEYEDNMTFCATLDQHVFCCDTCGWYCRIEEMSEQENGTVCDECFEGEMPDDE